MVYGKTNLEIDVFFAAFCLFGRFSSLSQKTYNVFLSASFFTSLRHKKVGFDIVQTTTPDWQTEREKGPVQQAKYMLREPTRPTQ